MTRRTFRARWVLPINAPPLPGGYVAVVDGKIAAVGSRDPGLGPATDLGDVCVLPGLVNAHTHLEFSSLPKPLGRPGMSLPEWIRTVIADRSRANRDAAAAIAAGLKESLAAGVVAIGEIATSPRSLYEIDALPQLTLFQEAIGFSAGRVETVAAEAARRLAAAGSIGGVSPHAPYTIHPKLLTKLVDLAIQEHAPIAMHLAESQEELQLLRDGTGSFQQLLDERSMWDEGAIPRGSRPLDYLRELARAPRSLTIHGNYFDQEEIAFLAQHRQRMSVVYCPRTHAYFEHESYPLEAMLVAGARVALGTDSRASTPDLNLLNDLRFAARSFPRVDPGELLRMATINAAEALGIADRLGSLFAGKAAHLATIPCNAGVADPMEPLFASDSPLTLLEA